MAGPSPSGLSVPVSEADGASAVARATGARRRRIHGDSTFTGFTRAAIAERIVGFTVHPEPGRDTWWRVGWIVDDIAAVELDVWLDPRTRRLGMSERHRPIAEARAPSEDPIIIDGERKRWIFRETRETVPRELLERICRRGAAPRPY